MRQKWGGLWFEVSPGKKLARLHLTNKLGVVMSTCNPSYMSRRIIVWENVETLSEK
jgi:hypothetical protein